MEDFEQVSQVGLLRQLVEVEEHVPELHLELATHPGGPMGDVQRCDHAVLASDADESLDGPILLRPAHPSGDPFDLGPDAAEVGVHLSQHLPVAVICRHSFSDILAVLGVLGLSRD